VKERVRERLPMTFGTPTVLVVEDEPLVRMVAIEEFQDMGFAVHVASDVAGALRILEQAAPLDLLFTDIQMPGEQNGWDLGRRVRALKPGLPVIYATGYGGETSAPVEGSAIVRKPYLFSEVRAALREVGVRV
jgi:CheY-like chemotaxis protein